MAGGQCLDIAAEGENLSLARLEALHRAKTGALIEASLMIGAYCAEVEPDNLDWPCYAPLGSVSAWPFK